MLPTALFIMRRDGNVLFVRSSKKSPWTLPSGSPRSLRSYRLLANAVFVKYYDDLSVISVHVVATLKEKILLKQRRTRCAIIECKLIGTDRDRMRNRMCYMNPGTLPQNVVSSDISGIIGMLQSKQSRLSA